METWRLFWTDADGAERRREFGTYLEAWGFNEQHLKGKGEVRLVIDRLPAEEGSDRTEAEEARRLEGGRRPARRRG